MDENINLSLLLAIPLPSPRALSDCGGDDPAHPDREAASSRQQDLARFSKLNLRAGDESRDLCGTAAEGREQEEEEEEGIYLPEGCLRSVAAYVANEPASLLSLLAMCGTCRQWRGVARDLDEGSLLAYDGFDNVFSDQPMVQRFRKLTSAAKEKVFASAAKLFSGYSAASCSGDGITDHVLQILSERVGPKLVRYRLQSSGKVTAAGLRALLSETILLEHAHLEDLPRAVEGYFLADLFERCVHLQTVHLSSMPLVSWGPCKMAAQGWADLRLTKLHVRGVNLDPEFGIILAKMPNLVELEIDGSARNISAASISCPKLQRVSYQVSSQPNLDEALAALVTLPLLKTLELVVKSFTLCSDQLRVVGMLPLVDLKLDSYIYRQQPTLSRCSYSHVDNEGVKALVDSICNRWCALASEMQPLKLSLCGASLLTHDAVSALLRLPILTELDIGGCCRIIAMDKMRLVAKVRAGREMLESGRKPHTRGSRFPGLFMT